MRQSATMTNRVVDRLLEEQDIPRKLILYRNGWLATPEGVKTFENYLTSKGLKILKSYSVPGVFWVIEVDWVSSNEFLNSLPSTSNVLLMNDQANHLQWVASDTPIETEGWSRKTPQIAPPFRYSYILQKNGQISFINPEDRAAENRKKLGGKIGDRFTALKKKLDDAGITWAENGESDPERQRLIVNDMELRPLAGVSFVEFQYKLPNGQLKTSMGWDRFLKQLGQGNGG